MISIRKGVTKEIVDIMVFITVNDNNDYTPCYSVLWATREAHNPNVQVAITKECSECIECNLTIRLDSHCWSQSLCIDLPCTSEPLVICRVFFYLGLADEGNLKAS